MPTDMIIWGVLLRCRDARNVPPRISENVSMSDVKRCEPGIPLPLQ